MKRETGWIGGSAVALAAVLGFSSLQGKPGSDARESAHGPEAKTGATATKSNTVAYQGPCKDLIDHLRDFVFPSAPADANFAPESCGDQVKEDAKSAATLTASANQLHIVLATLPDPLHTNLSLAFDRDAQAIQQAAQGAGYTFDSSWLPWETEHHDYAYLDDQQTADARTEEREDQPGVLLFRKQIDIAHSGPAVANLPYREDLIVFVIGEDATSGIHREQFKHAIEWTSQLRKLVPSNSDPPAPVQILGPSFSGSLPSLDQLLQDPKVAGALTPAAGGALRIYSGEVTSNVAANWFTARFSTFPTLHISFHSFQQDEKTVTDRYTGFLRSIGIGSCHLAIVSEDETAYGADPEDEAAVESKDTHKPQTTDDCTAPAQPSACSVCALPTPVNRSAAPGPTHLYYPRDISALRAAYQQQALFAGPVAASDSPRHTLRNDLTDSSASFHDTIRSYGGNQTALTEEALLLQVVSVMRAHRTQFILLRSSNTLDQLFLSQFFKSTYPEGRVVILGNDLLLRRDTLSSGLNGVTTLGTWPLLPEIDHWTAGFTQTHQHLHLTFPEISAQGTYVALRFLLSPAPSAACSAIQQGETFLPPNCDKLDIPDYIYPFWLPAPSGASGPVPLTWLSVLGNNGFWPVAALDTPKLPSQDLTWGYAASTVTYSIGHALRGVFFCFYANPRWRDLPLSMNVCLCLVLLWAVFHLICHGAPSITVKPTHRTSFVRLRRLLPHPNKSTQPRSHLALLVFGSALLAITATLLAASYGWMSPGGPIAFNPGFYSLFPVLVWSLGFFALASNLWVEHRLKPAPPDDVPASEYTPRPRSRLLPDWKNPGRLSDALKEVSGFLRMSAFCFVVEPLSHLLELLHLRKPASKLLRKTIAQLQRPAISALLAYVLITFTFYVFYLLVLDDPLPPQVRTLTYLRSVNLTTGVSPVVPLLLLTIGMYGWCWSTLRGICLFGEDRPVLPSDKSLQLKLKDGEPEVNYLTMLDDEHAARPIEELCWPFRRGSRRIFVAVFLTLVFAAWILARGVPLRCLGSQRYSWTVSLWIALSISALLTNAWQLAQLWLRLRELLVFLDRLPLRRTLQAMRGFTWNSIWKMGGNVLDIRYKVFYRQFEALNHLQNNLEHYLHSPHLSEKQLDHANECLTLIKGSVAIRHAFSEWYAGNWHEWTARDLRALQQVQSKTADIAAHVLTCLLVPAWLAESKSLLLMPPLEGDPPDPESAHMRLLVAELPAHIRSAEEVVCLLYLGFIQNILGRMRSLVMGITWLFLSIALVVPSYPFDPRPLLTGSVFALFAVAGFVIFTVYAQMFRDTTLSHLTNTRPGELGTEFWLKFIGLGLGPILGLVATIFPELSTFVSSWLQPSLSSIK